MSTTKIKAVQLAAITAGMAFAGAASADIMGWTGQGLLGYSGVSGNSESSSLNAAVDLGKTYGKWSHAFGVDAFFSESKADKDSDKESTAERYGADYKANYAFNKHDYVFGTVAYQKDLFGGVNEKWLEAIGYGRRIIDLPAHTLNGEVGIGARQETSQPDPVTGVETKNNEAVGLIGAKYNWAFSKTGNFYQNLSTEIGSDNTYGESVTGVNAKLSDVMSLGASYTVKHNSGIQGDFGKHSDKYTAINLTYAIK